MTLEALPDEPTVRELVHAIGGLTTILAAHMEGAGLTRITQVADHLGEYAAITAETEANAGDILAYWAGVLRDVADNRG